MKNATVDGEPEVAEMNRSRYRPIITEDFFQVPSTVVRVIF